MRGAMLCLGLVVVLSACGKREGTETPAAPERAGSPGEIPAGRSQKRTASIRPIEKESESRAPAKITTRDAGGLSSTTSAAVAATGRVLSGRVTDAGGAPIRDAVISVKSGTPVSGTSDGSGFYKINEMPLTTVTLAATAPAFFELVKPDISPDRETVNFVLQRRHLVKLRIRVVDEGTSEAIGQATLTPVEGITSGIIEEDKGMFLAEELAGTDVRIGVVATGYTPSDTGRIRLPIDRTSLNTVVVLGAPGTVTGRVIKRGFERDALPGIAVSLCARDVAGNAVPASPLATATTDHNGAFTLEQVPPGSWAVLAKQIHPPISASKPVHVNGGATVDAGEIPLGEVEAAIVPGRVLRLPSREGIEGLEVVLRNTRGLRFQATTGAEGRFQFAGIPPGSFGVYVPEYSLYTWYTYVEGAQPREALLYVGAGRLEGTVMHAGKPRSASVKVTQTNQYGDKTKTAGADGTFVFDGLAPGPWTVQVTVPGAAALAQDFPVEIPNGTTQQTFTLPSGRLVGKVVNATGEAVTKAAIALSVEKPGSYPILPTALTGEDGSFSIANLQEGTYTVFATKLSAGTGTMRSVVVPGAGESQPCTVMLNPDGGTLKSTALNMTTGGPLPDAWCNLFPLEGGIWRHGYKRGPDGVVTILHVPPGKYRVQVSSYGFAVSEKQIEILQDKTTEIEDVLYEAGALSIIVSDRNGMPVGDAAVKVTPEDSRSIEHSREEKTDRLGAVMIRGMLPGKYRVTAEPPGNTPIFGNAAVISHQIATLRLAPD